MPDKSLEPNPLLGALDAAGVQYVLIGGLAMVGHGSAHVTLDIDIAYSRRQENLAALVAALGPLDPQLRGADPDLPFIFDARTLRNAANLTLDTRFGAIDVLGEVSGVSSFEELWAHSVTMEFYGYAVQVASLPDLIQMKRAAGRLKDQLHLMELEALSRIQSESG